MMRGAEGWPAMFNAEQWLVKDFPEPNYLRLLCNVGGQTDCSYTNINEKKKKKKDPESLLGPTAIKIYYF